MTRKKIDIWTTNASINITKEFKFAPEKNTPKKQIYS